MDVGGWKEGTSQALGRLTTPPNKQLNLLNRTDSVLIADTEQVYIHISNRGISTIQTAVPFHVICIKQEMKRPRSI